MRNAFRRCAADRGNQQRVADTLVGLLPRPLQEAPVWFDKLTKVWRYEYGVPYDRMPEDMIIAGTNVQLPINELYMALSVANFRLSHDQLTVFLDRLADKHKHGDVLFEMRPLVNVKPCLQASYEIRGLGIGNTTCDWQVKGAITNIVFDVKNRIRPFLEHMKQLIPGLNRGDANILPSAPNPEDLFKSVEGKLKERCYLAQLQGVWIKSDIKEHEHKLTLYFHGTLSSRKVHFAILSDWENDAFILARKPLIKMLLRRTFKLTESKRFVTRDYA